MAKVSSRTAIIGIGNLDRGDDAIGRLAAKSLRDTVSESLDVYETDGEAASLIQLLEGVAAAYLIDACRSGSPAGTVYRLDAGDGALEDRAFGLSTHGLGLAEAIELARTLGTLPPRCIVYAIEGATFAAGAPSSQAAVNAAAAVARSIRAEVFEARGSVCDA